MPKGKDPDDFIKQNGLKIGSWMECRKNMIEHTHFKTKKLKKINNFILKRIRGLS